MVVYEVLIYLCYLLGGTDSTHVKMYLFLVYVNNEGDGLKKGKNKRKTNNEIRGKQNTSRKTQFFVLKCL